jgi:glycosyltransferase involved in cell wall biosynthesis
MRLAGGVTAVIPVHLPRLRTAIFDRAMESVAWQTRPVDAISIAVDTTHAGAAETRNRALAGVTTQWAAFLDSDDQWRPDHIASLLDCARTTGADLVYPWFTVPEGWDPFPQFEGQEFSAKALEAQNYIPVTVLVRTALLQDVGGFQPKGPPENPCDDWGAWDALLRAGAKFTHLNRRTWYWHWGDNTNGRGDRW